MLMTALSTGSVSRETNGCKAWTTAVAATTGSMVRWGIAACPPLPLIVAVKLVDAAMIVPAYSEAQHFAMMPWGWRPNFLLIFEMIPLSYLWHCFLYMGKRPAGRTCYYSCLLCLWHRKQICRFGSATTSVVQSCIKSKAAKLTILTDNLK